MVYTHAVFSVRDFNTLVEEIVVSHYPVETAITTNTGGVINQNIGYPGAENNIEPLKVEPADPDI